MSQGQRYQNQQNPPAVNSLMGCLGHIYRDIIENINDFIRDVPLNLHRNKLCYLKYGNYESDRCPSPSKLVEL